MTAALDDGDQARRAWADWQNFSGSDQLDSIAARWLPLVGCKLESLGGDPASSPLVRRARREAWANNQRLLAAAEPVLAAFEQAGVAAVLLKGAALALTVYPDRGGRPFGDVDVLVQPDSVEVARSILSDLGWRPARRVGGLPQAVRHGFDFRRGDGGAVDLHQYLLPECAWPNADALVWQRIEFAEHDGTTRRVLGSADQLLHVCVHGVRWSPVHAGTWVADAVALLRRVGDRLSWDTLIDEARHRRLAFQMSEALRVVSNVPGSLVPARVLLELRRSRVSWADRLECYAKPRPVLGPAGLWLVWCGWRRARRHRADVGGLLAFVAGYVGLDSRRRLVSRFAHHVRRRRAAGWRDPWGKGLSRRPTLAAPREAKR
jgi:hypothetical protein